MIEKYISKTLTDDMKKEIEDKVKSLSLKETESSLLKLHDHYYKLFRKELSKKELADASFFEAILYAMLEIEYVISICEEISSKSKEKINKLIEKIGKAYSFSKEFYMTPLFFDIEYTKGKLSQMIIDVEQDKDIFDEEIDFWNKEMEKEKKNKFDEIYKKYKKLHRKVLKYHINNSKRYFECYENLKEMQEQLQEILDGLQSKRSSD